MIGFDRSPYFIPHGFLVKLIFDPTQVNFEIITFNQNLGVIRRMDHDEQSKFMSEIELRSRNLTDKKFLQASWEDLCRTRTDEYWGRLAGYGRVMRELNHLFHFARFVSPSQAAVLLNLVRCSAHQEILETMLERMYRKRKPLF